MITLLQLRRMDIGMTQTALGNAIGVNPSVICQFERLERKPWPKVRKHISRALGVREEILFNDLGWPISYNEAVKFDAQQAGPAQ